VARNLETKFRCDDATLESVRHRADEEGATPFEMLRQVDTYFAVRQGRLKVREFEDERGQRGAELIAYARPDETGSRWSNYQRVQLDIDTIDEMRRALESACGVSATIEKRREVAILRRTRLHLDRVAGLGCFVELETVAGAGDGDGALAQEHSAIIRALGLSDRAVIDGSYGDLFDETEEV